MNVVSKNKVSKRFVELTKGTCFECNRNDLDGFNHEDDDDLEIYAIKINGNLAFDLCNNEEFDVPNSLSLVVERKAIVVIE